MKRVRTEDKIRELMARFVAEISAATAMRRFDPNRIAENMLVPLLKVVFGYQNLRNLNKEEREDYPGIDLADDEASVAFQITSSKGSDKIKYTLEQFVKHEHYRKYQELKIYILTKKQDSYSGSGYDKIINGRFSFNKDKDIWDYTTIMSRIGYLEDEELEEVQQILESIFERTPPSLLGESEEMGVEPVYLNLLTLTLPDTIYLADIDIDRDAVITESSNHGIKLWRRSTNRNVVRAALEQRGLGFGVDWVDYEGKIFSFHDLDDVGIPLSQVIDKGTVTAISPEEFYEVDENQERVFKSLLQRCLQQKLYHQQVKWQHEERLYIFTEEGDARVRRERWPGNPTKGREVFKQFAKKKQPDETLYYKHLAFRTAFLRFDSFWYIQIKPDWFFSHNRYHKSFYNADSVDWLKKREKNPQVFNEFRLIVHFLKHGRQPELFEDRQLDTYPFLSFGELVTFSSPAKIDDNKWLEKEQEGEQQRLTEAQQQLDLGEK